MGLFVFSKSAKKAPKSAKGKGKNARKGRTATDPAWDLEKVRRAWHTGGLVVAALTLVIGWGVVRTALIDYCQTRHALETPAEWVTLNGQPAWMSESIAGPMREAAANALSQDPFDGSGVQAAAQRVAQTPWIQTVHQVHRGTSGQLIVDADFRTPMVAVRDSRNTVDHYLVDDQGVVLAGPWRWRTVRDQGFIVLEGVPEAPPAPGNVWPGEPLQHALALAMVLIPEPFAGQIEAVHIENNPYSDTGVDLALYTTEERRVLWGAPLGYAMAAEAMTDQMKLDNLRALHRTYGHIDSVRGTVEVNHVQPVEAPAPGSGRL